jgi:hypothetical protein
LLDAQKEEERGTGREERGFMNDPIHGKEVEEKDNKS